MTMVKICGITSLEDAVMSVEFGADILGFNFFVKSPRYIAPKLAEGTITKLPTGVITVGVFVNESIDTVSGIAKETGIDLIQLHGDETPEYAEHLRKTTGLQVIKAFRVSEQFDASDVVKYEVDAILLDSYSAAERGGTGEKFDWNVAAQVRELIPKLYLAGGLNPQNVGEANRSVRPFALDACSGLESSKGIKDRRKVEAFIRNVREAL